MIIDFIEFFVQVLQLPVIVFIFCLCLRAKKILHEKSLWWIGVAFIGNFTYMLTSIFDQYSFVKGIHPYTYYNVSPLDYYKTHSSRFPNFLDNISFIFFFIPLYYYAFRISAKKKFYIKYVYPFRSKNRFLYIITLMIFFIVFMIFIQYYDQNLFINILLSLFKASCLVFLVSFFKRTKHASKWSNILLSFGFYSWALLQFMILNYNNSVNIITITSICFSVSLISKIFILIGLVLIVLDVEKSDAKTIIEVNTRKEAFRKSSIIFENILKNTFHEITFPLNSLGNDIDNLSGYLSRYNRVKFKDLALNYERVRAIIAVSKSSYKPEVSGFGDFEFLERKKIESISVNYLIEKAISSIKSSYKNIDIEHSYGSNVIVKCNQNELLQVLTNLIKNSIEAYENIVDKKVILRSYNEKIDVHNIHTERNVIVEIEDFASGMESEFLTKIWERGFSTKIIDEKVLVRGEGLYVVKDLCQKNNIIVNVQSPVAIENSKDFHRGTKFTLYFKKNKNQTNG